MISKWKLELLAFLTSLTLISVGFSSWQITSGPVMESLNGSIQTEAVYNAKDYVTFNTYEGDNKSGISLFTYNEDGFISYNSNGEAEAYTQSGEVTLFYTVNVTNSRKTDSLLKQDLEGELKYLRIDVTISLVSVSTGIINTNALNKFLTAAPVDPSNYSIQRATHTGSGTAYNDIEAQNCRFLKNGNVVSFIVNLPEIDGTTETTYDDLALTFNFKANTNTFGKSVAQNLSGNEFVFQTAISGLSSIPNS